MFDLSFILSILILLPFIVGSVVLVVPLSQRVREIFIFSTLLVISFLSLYLYFSSVELDTISYSYTLIERFGVSYSVGIDGVSLLIVMIVGLSFSPLFVLLKDKSRGYWGNMLLLQSSLMGVVLAQDLVMFYIFWEAMLIPIFIMIGLYGEDGKVVASLRLLLYTMIGSLFMLASIIYLGYSAYLASGEWSFSIDTLMGLSLLEEERIWLFFGFMLAFSIKVPLFPFHQWLSDGYAKAPIGATFALSAVASKVAVYAILRFVLPLFPQEYIHFSDMFIILGLFSMLFFAFSAMRQDDPKRLLAYSSASHLGLVISAIFALNYEGFSGGVFQIVAHALGTGFLFLLVAIIEQNTTVRSISKLGGIASVAPIFAIYFAIGMFSIIGLPSTSGFIGEFLSILGVMKSSFFYAFIGTLSIIIGAIYMLRFYKSAFFTTTSEYTKSFKELSKKQIFALLPFVLIIFLLGLYPKIIQDKIDPTIKSYINLIEETKDKR
jgi:NADH-quinone oxidoreductase subunit M